MGRLKQSTEKIQELLDKVESGEVGSKVTPDWNANLGEIGYIQNRPFRIIDSASGDEYKFDTPLKESDFTRIVQEDEYGNKVSVKWEKIISDPNAYIMGVFTNGYWNARHDAFYKGAIRPLGPLYRRGYSYDEGDYRKYSLYIENISVDTGDYYEEYSKLIVENISDSGTAFPKADVYVLTSEDNPVQIDAIDENYLPDTIARTNDVDELREETTALWENLDHGTFPNLTAGDLAGRGESVPAEFGFRASGGKSIKDGRAYIKSIKGNSVVWNNASAVVEGGNAVLPQGARLIRGHKYLIIANRLDGYGMYVFTRKDSMDIEVSGALQKDNGIRFFTSEYDAMSTGVAGQENSLWWYVEGNYGQANLHDLTQMFGAGNEPTTIEEFNARKPIVADEYAYNEGEVIHMNTESIKSVGDNAWDEEWEVGGINQGTGESFDADNNIRSKDYNRIIGGQEYSFLSAQTGALILYDEHYNYVDYWNIAEGQLRVLLIADNASYFKISIYDHTYKNGTMLRLNHSGWKSETGVGYEPYWQDTLPLPIISKYFPDGMKSAGSAHDEIRFNKATKKWEYSKGKIKSVDLGSLDWLEGNYNGYSAFYSRYNALNGLWADHIFYLCAKYQPAVERIYTEGLDKSIAFNNGYYGNQYTKDEIIIRDTSYTDAASLKASLQGVMLYYESNDWEWVELDAEDQNFRDYYNVADFGTEMSQSEVPSAPFSADIIYQFNAVDMIREHELEITELQSIIATMQAQLTSLINGGQ